MNVAQKLVECLAAEGVEYIFGIPGEENLEVIEAIAESPIRFITTRHEQGAAFMADVYGRLTGKAGVCLATLGPGATNLITGVADANSDGAPLVAITGQVSSERISLPENLVIIGDSVFSDCTSLASIKIPGNVTSIGSSAFSSCSALREIELSDSVESIGSFAFSWCGSLTTIKFSNSLKRIDGYAFSNCTSLTSVRIPESVIKIGDKVFSSCDSLTITVTEGSYAEEYCKQNNLSYSIANNLS